MSDFFDQETGYDDEMDSVPSTDRPAGASILVNGSYQTLEAGAPFLQAVQSVALQAGFGKFKVLLNGTEVRPSSAPSVVESNMSVELRPFDEAG
jgi:hypothetical protein